MLVAWVLVEATEGIGGGLASGEETEGGAGRHSEWEEWGVVGVRGCSELFEEDDNALKATVKLSNEARQER